MIALVYGRNTAFLEGTNADISSSSILYFDIDIKKLFAKLVQSWARRCCDAYRLFLRADRAWQLTVGSDKLGRCPVCMFMYAFAFLYVACIWQVAWLLSVAG